MLPQSTVIQLRDELSVLIEQGKGNLPVAYEYDLAGQLVAAPAEVVIVGYTKEMQVGRLFKVLPTKEHGGGGNCIETCIIG